MYPLPEGIIEKITNICFHLITASVATIVREMRSNKESVTKTIVHVRF
jgi:hypothetical protein